jgi:fluoride exporter
MNGWWTCESCTEMNNFILIAIGGALGSVSRWGCQRWIYQLHPHPFPFGTFAVNIVGSFLIGLFYAVSEKGNLMNSEWRLFLTTGFCGGFTTFSTFSFETLSLLKDGNYAYAILYVVLSVILGIAGVFAGMFIIKLI